MAHGLRMLSYKKKGELNNICEPYSNMLWAKVQSTSWNRISYIHCKKDTVSIIHGRWLNLSIKRTNSSHNFNLESPFMTVVKKHGGSEGVNSEERPDTPVRVTQWLFTLKYDTCCFFCVPECMWKYARRCQSQWHIYISHDIFSLWRNLVCVCQSPLSRAALCRGCKGNVTGPFFTLLCKDQWVLGTGA